MMKSVSAKKLGFFVLILTVLCLVFSSVCLAVSKPDQVESLKAQPSVTSVSLSWSKVKDCDAYAVFYYSPSSDKYTFIKNVSDNSCKVTGLDEGETYYFAVQSYNNDDGDKLYGKVSDYVKTTTKIEEPGKVKNLDTASLYSTKLKLTWKSVPDAKYAVYFYNAGTKKYSHIDNTASTSLVVRDLDPETTYQFAVRAYKKIGGKVYYGDFSSKLKVTTEAPPLEDAEARKLFNNAIDVYMDWVYSCSYTSSSGYIYRDFYGKLCKFAPVNHSSIKSISDLEKMLSKYFAKDLYENELYLYREVGDKLYYYAEGGSGDPDNGVKHYTDTLKEINHKKYRYTLYPVYYPKYENDRNPDSFIFTIVRSSGRWIFDGNFYTCCAKIKD